MKKAWKNLACATLLLDNRQSGGIVTPEYCGGVCLSYIYEHYDIPHVIEGEPTRLYVPRRRFDLSGDLREAHEACRDTIGLQSIMKIMASRGAWTDVFETCSVYVVSAEGFGHTKVGISCNPIPRLKQLQCANFAKLRYHALLWFDNWTDAERAERLVFKAADEMGIRARGEWLTTDSDEAFTLALKAARYANLPCRDSRTHLLDLQEGLKTVKHLYDGPSTSTLAHCA